MNQTVFGLLVFAWMAMISTTGFAQGCSDAGFCTAGNLAHPVAKDPTNPSSATVEYSVGSGEKNTTIQILQATARHAWKNNWVLEVKCPLYAATGGRGTVRGLGDPMATLTLPVYEKEQRHAHLVVGARVSTGRGNRKSATGDPLPMPYQPNLGTTDLILGLDFRLSDRWSAAVGWQQPIVQYNQNGYLPELDATQSAYFPARNLRRKGDVLLRCDYRASYRRFTAGGGPLLIYHVGKDQIDNPRGSKISVANSDGLTVNATAFLAYSFLRYQIEARGGRPLVVREQRPDGLTRAWVATIGLTMLLGRR